VTKVVENNKKTNGNLPIGWGIAQVKDICDIIRGVSYKKPDSIQEAQKGYLPILRATNIQDNSLILDKDLVYVPSALVSANQRLKIGDIVIATSSGSKHLVGKTAQVKKNWRGAFGAFCAAIRSTIEIDYRYLGYFFNSPTYKDVIAAKAIGVNINNLRRGDIEELKIPLAPPNEQKRIVAEIEKQFSRLDKAVENLKRVKANLKRYKASVLKAAVEGKLTEEWRKTNPDVDPADKLLHRILAERRKKWEEAELAKMRAKGKKPKDDKWKKKYKEPSQADISTLNELPNGWHWTITDQLFWFVTSGSRGWAKYYSDSGAVFFRIGNLDHNSVSLDLNKIQCVKPPKGAEGTRTKVEENDILISITADVGMIGVVPRSFEEAYINQHISLARPVSSVNSLYIAWYLTSRLGQNQFVALQRGATKAGLGLDDIRSVNIPIPPFEEQAEVISQIEKRLSVVHEIEIEVDKNLKRTVRLRQSILKKAFSGKLVS
jgi:type I restriction enzyme S subunit